MLPEVCTKPGSTCVSGAPRRVLARSGIVPDVGHHMLNPAFRLWTIEVFCRFFSTRYQPEYQLCERKMELAEIALFGDPVVHLDIDIGVVVSVPRGVECVCPKTLEVRRKAAFAGAAYEEISSEIVVQCSEGIVLRTLCV